MKKAFIFLTVISITVFFAAVSCKKTTYPAYQPNNSSGATPSINQLFAAFRSTPQNLSVNAGRDTIVYGAQGTMLHFYTNSFKNANGGIITSGIIYLQLIEMYKPGDMIRNRATTMAGGKILQSAGQITMTASLSSGEQVFANKYGIGFSQASASANPMALFYGGTNNTDSTTTWTQSDTTQKGTLAIGTTTNDSVVGQTTQNTNYYYFDTCSSFSWANCDWFYATDSQLTTVSVVLPDTSFNASNTQVFLVLPNVSRWGNTANTYTAVLGSTGGYGSDDYIAATNTLKLESEGHTTITPAGLKYELVVITNKNGAYYYYQQSGTVPANGLLASANMTAASIADITTKLQGL